MSTRCHIIILDEGQTVESPQALLYRHSDGYPQGECGVVEFLARFLPLFSKHRGWDPEYLAAQLVARMIKESRENLLEYHRGVATGDADYARDRARELPALERWDGDFLGYGICREIHGDIEYAYVIEANRCHVFKAAWDADPETWERLTTDEEAHGIMRGVVPARWQEE